MRKRISSLRTRTVDALLGVELGKMLTGYQASLERAERWQEALDERMVKLEDRLVAQTEILKRERDRTPEAAEALELLRASEAYAAAVERAEPLVSVRIASYTRTRELVDVAVRSVLEQTYPHFELIIVNDGPNPMTREAVLAIGDPRIRYEELPRRSTYPDDRHARWMVAGSPAMNRGAELARGDWIAPLDDDDEFSPDHLEKLVALARRESVELAYGAAVRRNLVNGDEEIIWSDPPAVSRFSFQSAVYLRLLHEIFPYDEESWIVSEPGDWNLARRMVAAGVRTAATRDIVATMHQVPYTHKDQTE